MNGCNFAVRIRKTKKVELNQTKSMNMMKKIFASVCMLAVLYGCEGDGKVESDGSISTDSTGMVICDFDLVKDTITIPLSQWVEDFRIVRFENADTALFKMWFPIITDKYIGIRQRDQRAFKLFDREGKYLCDVGGTGNGPGEYTLLYSEAIDEKNGWIYLAPFAWSKYLLKYDTNGKFIGEVDMGEYLNKPRIQLLNDGSLALAHLYFKDNNSMMVAATVTPDGTVTKCTDTPASLQIIFRNPQFAGFNHEVWHYGCTDEMKFAYTFSDTLYAYDHKANTLKADYVMKNYRKTEDIYCIHFPLPGKYLTWVRSKGSIVVDLKTQQSHFYNLTNDFVGGMKTNANFVNGYFFNMFEPSLLMERIEGRLKEKDCTEEDKKVLKELYDSLNEDDNNIMFVGKLKK